MNKKYNIQEFIDDANLVIKCDDLFELRKVGKYLWNCSTFKINQFNPTTGPEFPYIAWYSTTGTNFNPLRHKYPEQIIINFEDVIFEEFVLPDKWCIKMEHQEYFDWNNNLFNTRLDDSHKVNNYYGYYEKLIYIRGTPNNADHFKYKVITFDQFKEYVLKESKDNYDYLIKYLKKLNIK